MRAQAPDSKKYYVPSVESACCIIRAVFESGEGVSMAELSAISGTSRTSTLRIISSLCNHGFLSRKDDGRLTPGNVLRVLGSRFYTDISLRQRAIPILSTLAQSTGETAHLVIPLETQCFLQEVIDSPQLVRVASRPGTLIDYHCSATGKCLLAFDNERLLMLRQSLSLAARTGKTITAWESLDRNLNEVRARGYAIDEEEYHDGVRCIAAPVFNSNQSIVAAIGITGTTASLSKDRIASVAQTVVAAATELCLTS
jgi:DNA-binding IclR family transcriptional regulator